MQSATPAISTTSPDDAPRLARARDTLRRASLRATGPRIAVMTHLLAVDAPRSHAELVEALGQRGFDRATVYRNLMDLTRAGLLRRADLGDHVWRFERARNRTGHDDFGHPHFVCTSCGDITCLKEVGVVVPAQGDMPRAVTQKKVNVQLRGTCDRC